MRIYTMTATFGKLEHETLTLKPGLNIIEAPNEWGKSTWCAFLVNMLYGMDTRSRSTGSTLADKERYAPWSGSPMSGRIELNWNGRDITIERNSKGRLIFGEFRAYETETGIEISELNGLNCGQQLLGVERSVFTRAGFLKLSDLPVTQDEALRRRLNNLVTTGDESGAGDKLQSTLKDLKNKCRHNKTGLLPQAETQRDILTNQLAELESLTSQSKVLKERQAELEAQIAQLENHRAALQYAAAQEDAHKVSQALQAQADAQAVYDGLLQNCAGLPAPEEARQTKETIRALQQQYLDLQMESGMMPPLPEQPAVPAHYENMSADDAIRQAQDDHNANQVLENGRKKWNRTLWICWIAAIVAAAGCTAAGYLSTMPLLYAAAGGILMVAGISLLSIGAAKAKRFRAAQNILFDRHPGLCPDRWITDAEEFATCQATYSQKLAEVTAIRGDLDQRLSALQEKIAVISHGKPLSACQDYWNQICASYDALASASRDLQQAKNHAEILRSVAKIAEPPKFPDTLTHSAEETNAKLFSADFELNQLRRKLGQYEGRSEALGQEAALRTQLKAVNRRIQRLEDTYAALELAQTALSAATTELQRRFAPRISKRAQALFQKLTGGHYDRLTLSSDLTLNTSAGTESSLRPAMWRSEGTVDQLYLALRLAVAEELTPDAPLILDDALVRFDDKRLAAAMDILNEAGETKQVILFTCQGREKKLQGEGL